MQVVENVEEHVLCLLLAAEKLHIVDDEHVHHLVEVAEVVDRVVPNRVDELVREALGAHVQHCFVRLTVLDLQPNGVRKMRFAQTNSSVDEEGVEGRSARLVGHRESGAARKTVALAFDKVLKGVVGIQVRVNVELTKSWNHKRILDGGRFAYDRHGHFSVAGCTHFCGGHVDGVRAAGCTAMDVFHDDAVFQARVRTQFFPYRFAKQGHVVLFEPLVKELGRDLNRQDFAIKFHRLDGGEPRFERLGADVVLDDSKALGPDTCVILVHVVSGGEVDKEWWKKRPFEVNQNEQMFRPG